DEAITFLSEKKVIDDVRVAGLLAERLCRDKAWAKERICADLDCRGASPESIEHALQRLPPDADSAQRFLQKHRGAEVQQLSRRLAAAGYDAEIIRACLGLD
ncbi:MAG: RecX family transcriptional regulator, partial [Armatimonadetes bacterium]|nr:RecX family transcriptional regulator [Armatimonadota bacterium]